LSYNPQNPNGQSTMANSSPVVIASNQSAVSVSINQTTQGTTNAVTLNGVGGVTTPIIPITAFASGSLFTSSPIQLFDDTFATSALLDTTNRWSAPTSAGGGIAAAVPVGGGNVTLGTGTTANGWSTLQSQFSFPQAAPGFLEIYHAINIVFPAPTNTYLFWGSGTIPGTPTASAPLTDAIGFEVDTTGKMFAVCYSGGSRNVIQDLSSSGNNTQPGDSSVHKYFIFYRGDLSYWCIDNRSNIVATMLTGAPGPINNTLPLRLLAIAGPTPPGSNVTLNDNAVFMSDTASSSSQISDGNFAWRKATVSASGALSVSNSGIPTVLGAQTTSNSTAVNIASDQIVNTSDPDLIVTGQSAQTAIVNNILTTTSGTAATDLKGYKSALVQIISTGTAGTFIFEGSNDNVNFQTVTVYSQLILTGTPITAAITATASNLGYVFPIIFEFYRVRIVSTITGGSIQAFSRFTQNTWTPAVFQVTQATAANLAVTATVATVTSVTAVAAINSVATTNGLSIGTVVTATTPATTSIKATAGRLHNMSVGNPNSTPVYLKIFNVAAPTLGTTAANMNYLIPATSNVSIPINDLGLFFSTAIVIAVTGGISLTDNTTITAGCSASYSWI